MANIIGYTNAVGPTFADTTTGFISTINVQSLSAARTLTLPNLAGQVSVTSDPQFFQPTTGTTVSPVAQGDVTQVFINPAGTIAALTITLPTGIFKGQRVYAAFTQIVTALTITATNLDTKGLTSPTSAAVTSAFAWAWDSVSTKWNRVL